MNSEFRPQNSDFGSRRGYTMAELMIVVIIMIMLVAATLPIAKKVMDDSHVREASRQLNAYFAMVKSRAIHTGRPCGIFFECEKPSWVTDSATGGWPVRMVTQMHMAETPAPYSGSTLDAVGKIIDNPLGGKLFSAVDTQSPPQPNQGEMAVLQSLLTLNEQFTVRFDHKGNWYPCTYTVSGCVYSPPNPLPAGYVFPHGYGSANARGVRFQIRRTPTKVGNSLAMPTGTCIDMTYSGNGPIERGFPNFLPNLDAMAIMFTPNGGVDQLYYSNSATSQIGVPSNALFFLVGKVEKVNDPNSVNYADIRDSNLADPTSLWVTVGRGNGQVTTSENTPDPTVMAVTGDPPNLKFQKYLRAARQVATSREQMKGR